MKKYLQYSHIFLLLSALTVIILGIFVWYCDKIQMHLWLNGTHNAASDFFFRYYTVVGEWVPYLIVALLLFYKAGWASFLLADVAISGLIGQGLKYWFDTDRPYYYFSKFAPDIQLQLVDGVELSQWYSFPSGHTTTFFALFLTLSIILIEWYQNKNAHTSNNPLLPNTYYLIPVICFLLALLGGYSRIYLSQHFAEDILGGMLLGILTTIGLLLIVPIVNNTHFWHWNVWRYIRRIFPRTTTNN